MTRARYSSKESLNRILRIFQNKALPEDAPDTITGEVLSEDEALSDLAELLAGSLPNETAVFPSAISVPELKVGTSPNYAYIETDGTFRLTGSASAWEDLRVDGLNVRVGATAPTDETGFRGNSNFYSRNFVHNQADEVQFDVQFPHAWKEGGVIEPHVHFSPWITGTANVQAAKFILDYYWADVSDTFQTGSFQYAMSYTWTGSRQWTHQIADGLGLTGTAMNLSSIMKCRLYRDNSVADNLAGKVAFLYFDIHYEVDSFGSSQEYVK